MNGFTECAEKGVNVYPCFRIIKRHLTLFIVHKHPNLLRALADGYVGGRLCAEGVVGLVSQAEKPVSIAGVDSDLAFPVDRVAGYTDVPVSFIPHFHFPVVASRGKALLAQDTHHAVKAFWVVRK